MLPGEASPGDDTDAQFPRLFDLYKRYMLADGSAYEDDTFHLQLPIVPIPVVSRLCASVTSLFSEEPMVLEIDAPITIVGDIHGHVVDLFRTLGALGLPPERSYLFLGDLVDRGEFSMETVVVVFLLKVLHPRHIFVIRGNHEFREMTRQSGFREEVSQIYDSWEPEREILGAFSWLPIAAVVSRAVLCVHGGIGPEVRQLAQLAAIPRPLFSYRQELVKSIVWSDPCPYIDDFEASTRGVAYYFGVRALESFLDRHELKLVVRGHECVADGVQVAFDGRLVTVFSASNYCGLERNKAGVLVVSDPEHSEAVTFAPLRMFSRADAEFFDFDVGLPAPGAALPKLQNLTMRKTSTAPSHVMMARFFSRQLPDRIAAAAQRKAECVRLSPVLPQAVPK
jgi:protein phosphatase